VTHPAFATSYAAALASYVADGTEQRLKAAYDLGRAAVEQGLGVLDVAAAHNDAVVRVARDAADTAAVIEAAGEFLIESLAAFEVVQRGATEAWRAAWEERRRARMVRELSAVLADADIASAAGDSAEELAQLVVEMLREMTGSAEATVEFDTPGSGQPVRASTVEPEADTWSEILQPVRRPEPDEHQQRDVIAAPIVSISGTRYGRLEAVGYPGVPFHADDRATAKQVADLAAAWLDRTHRAPGF
jgi:hypothetical protein